MKTFLMLVSMIVANSANAGTYLNASSNESLLGSCVGLSERFSMVATAASNAIAQMPTPTNDDAFKKQNALAQLQHLSKWTERVYVRQLRAYAQQTVAPSNFSVYQDEINRMLREVPIIAQNDPNGLIVDLTVCQNAFN